MAPSEGTSCDGGHLGTVQDILAEVAAFLAAPALGRVCMSSHSALVASDVMWACHLDELCRSVGRYHGRNLFPQTRGLSGSAARAEYSLCASSFRGILRQAVSEAGYGPPTATQVLQFVVRVRGHHSWYKHLPIEEGVAFRLGMSPVAGMRQTDDQYIEYVMGDGTQFHYTWCTTEDYRRRFHFFVWEEICKSSSDPLVTTTPDMARPLLVPLLPSSIVPVTACVHIDASGYYLLADVYRRFKSSKDAGSSDLEQLPQATSLYTRRATGQGLPAALLQDMEELYAFEKVYPCKTWWDPTPELLRDAERLCASLFPSYSPEAVQLQAGLLLFGRASHDTSIILVLADGARAQVSMISALLECIRYVWGDDSVPDVSLSMTEEEMQKSRREMRKSWEEVEAAFLAAAQNRDLMPSESTREHHSESILGS